MIMINILFYLFVFLGLGFFIYLILAYWVSKKRDRMITQMEKVYTSDKFNKCPHCGVLNPLEAEICEFCKKELPHKAHQKPLQDLPSPSPVPPEESTQGEIQSAESPVSSTPSPTGKVPVPASENPQLEKFPFNRAWPLPNSTVLITMISIYVLVIVGYAFLIGIYTMGKAGVKQLEEVSRKTAKRQAEKEASRYVAPSASTVKPRQYSAPVKAQSPTPVSTPTPLVLTGSAEEQITQLMLHLESKDWNTAIQAKKMLISKGKPAADALATEIDHPDIRIRTHVISALGEIGAPESAPYLIDTLDNEDSLTVIQSAYALGNIKSADVVDELIAILKHPDWRVRHAAVLSLEKQDDIKALTALIPLQNDKNDKVKNAAAKAVTSLQESEKKE